MQISLLKQDLNQSLKKGDNLRVATLRYLISAVNNFATAKYGLEAEAKVSEADVTDVIKKQVKTHKESIEAFTKAGRQDLADKESAELAILESFVPAEMSDADLRKILAPIATSGELNFGLLMKQAMAAVAGQADGGRVSGMLRSLLPKPK